MTALNATNLNPQPLIDLETISFTVDALGQVNVRDDHGNVFENISPVRLFPLSRPHQWIALLDATGRELICIDDPQKLGEINQQILENELSKREFVPILQRVVWVSGNSEPCEWRVETDRGPTSFILKDESDVRRLGDHGVIVVDSFGIRYFIPDRNKLDKYSCRIIEWYV